MRITQYLNRIYTLRFLPITHISIFLAMILGIFALKFFIKIYRILHTDVKITEAKCRQTRIVDAKIFYEEKIYKRIKRKYKRIIERLDIVERNIQDVNYEQIIDLEKRIKAIEELCEETPEEQEQRLSLSIQNLNSQNLNNSANNFSSSNNVSSNNISSNNVSSSNNISCDTSFRNSGYLKNSINPAKDNTMNLSKKKNTENINHSNMSIDMSESLMLEL